MLTDEQGHQGVIQKLFDIYQEIPHPVVVYQCRKDTTEEELIIFFQRAKSYNVYVANFDKHSLICLISKDFSYIYYSALSLSLICNVFHYECKK